MDYVNSFYCPHFIDYIDAVIAIGRRHSSGGELDFAENMVGGQSVGFEVYDKQTSQLLFRTVETREWRKIGDRDKRVVAFELIGGRVTSEMFEEVKLELAGKRQNKQNETKNQFKIK